MDKVLVILGPTATGKTDLSLELAKKFNGELVSCDSRQVYKGLDIGTGKLPSKEVQVKKGSGFWEIESIPIWMYDVADPKEQFTVRDYVERAEKVIEDILSRNKLPIIVGGTGLYLKALLEGLPNLDIPVDYSLREELQKLSLEKLQQRLQEISSQRWNKLNKSDRQNPRRLIRAVELGMMYGYVNKGQRSNVKCQKQDVLKIGLKAPREVLNKRIFERLISRVDQGLIEEAKKLQQNGLSLDRMRELGLEYGVLADLLEGKISQKEFMKKLNIKIHQYAKRQMTWFKREKDANWFDTTNQGWKDRVEDLVKVWYYGDNGPQD